MENVEFLPLNKIALDYLMKVRQLEPETIEAFKISLSKTGEIQIPFYDNLGDLRAVKRRGANGQLLDRKRPGENNEWIPYQCKSDCIKGSKPALLGSNLVTDFSKPLLLCFGDYDTLTIYGNVDVNPVSPPFGDQSLTWIDHQFDWLEEFSKIIIFPDFDEDPKIRRKLHDKIEEMSRRIGKHKCLLVQEQHALGCKDPNELFIKKGLEALTIAITNAEYISEPGLEFLADYEEEESQEGVPTGYPDRDRATGGLNYGGLTILAGDTNAGKTTEMLNIMANVTSYGHKCFYWSGEQKPGKYRWWYEQIIAGPDFVDSRLSNKTGRLYYYLKNDLVSRVRAWYRESFIHYDKRGFDAEEFFRIMELAVRRYGVFLICIDNLMAFTGDAEDYYAAQAAFVESCHNFAIDWNVHIILAVHNKKSDPTKPGTLNDIEGSKKIQNWADFVYQHFRVSEALKGGDLYGDLDAISCLVKNRETSDLVDVGLKFDSSSNRLYQAAFPEDLRRLMGWELASETGTVRHEETIQTDF